MESSASGRLDVILRAQESATGESTRVELALDISKTVVPDDLEKHPDTIIVLRQLTKDQVRSVMEAVADVLCEETERMSGADIPRPRLCAIVREAARQALEPEDE